MGTCFIWVLLLVGIIFSLMTLIRWFEQTADAFDNRHWHQLFLYLMMPFTVWLFPGRFNTSRQTMVPLHEPARGFGTVSRTPTASPRATEPPPGTPKEFLGLPKVPPKKSRAPLDQEKVAKLRQKMREQGMLDDQGEE